MMKLVEALRLAQQPIVADAATFRVFLACSFTPLHLQTFLTAFLKRQTPQHNILIQTGLYGDCLANLDRATDDHADGIAVALEWRDLDPRFGWRRLSGWRPGALPDVLATATRSTKVLQNAIERVAQAVPVVVCFPTLPLPPMAVTPGWQDGSFALRIRQIVADFALQLAANPHIRVVSQQRLDHRSPPGERLDMRAELNVGFPYRLNHAAAVARLMARLLRQPPAKKGLITDLDDTFWAGIVGEVGVDAISWSLDQNSHAHALYQQMLSSLAEAGVLVGVASKNDPDVVQQALARGDLICSKERLFPLEVHWQAKSESVDRILRAWNIAADSVVFVDNSPMELAEVQAAFPSMECHLFPGQDEQAVYRLIERLRDLFGKDRVSEEDTIRQQSLRGAASMRHEAHATGHSQDDFLRAADAEVSVSFQKDPTDRRALELINKTNQFNLNGRRFDEGAWLAYLRDPETVLMTVSYKDKYGPLGKIAVLAGRLQGRVFIIDTWVLSCRAFSRRIEHRCLETLFDRFDLDEVCFAFEATSKNGPLRQIVADILGAPLATGSRLARAAFSERCPALFDRVTEVSDV